VYLFTVFIVNTVFFIRTSKNDVKPIIFSFTTFKEKLVIYFPYLFFKPSAKWTVNYKWWKLFLAFILICMFSLGAEFVSLTMFAGIRKISALDLQLGLSFLMMKENSSQGFINLTGNLFNKFTATETVGFFSRLRKYSRWIIAAVVPILAVAKKRQPDSDSDSDADFENGGPIPEIVLAPVPSAITPLGEDTVVTAPRVAAIRRTRGRVAPPIQEEPVIEQIVPPEETRLGFDEMWNNTNSDEVDGYIN